MMSLVFSFVLTFLSVLQSAAAPVGVTLPDWQEGMLDIHAINTGSGECSFIIFPDGTTLLVDAGDLYGYTPPNYSKVPARPSGEEQPWRTYADYIRHFLPEGRTHLDYCLLTHYHIDHFGFTGEGRTMHESGNYALAGLMGLYSEVPFDVLIDRSSPDYPECDENSSTANYIRFVKYNSEHGSLRVERFELGSDTQMAPRYRPELCPDFHIFGYAASGLVWDGRNVVDTKARYENGMSCAFLLSYGKFDYFSSGDMNQRNTCSAVAKSIGRKLEAMKAHHHLTNEASYAIESSVYQPQVVVTHCFYERDIQPNQSIIKNYSGTQDMFFTNLPMTLVESSPEIYKDCKCTGGHLVIRVAPDGEFYVYVLDDTDKQYKIKSVHGPYKSE